MAKQPNRPANLPEEAKWVQSKNRWEAGAINANGKTVGPWKIWRKNGQLWMEMEYDEQGKHINDYRRYHPDGSISQEGSYKAGKLDGWLAFYRQRSGNSKEPFPREVYYNQIVKVLQRYVNGQALGKRYLLQNGQEVTNYLSHKPASVPKEACWNQSDYEWEMGPYDQEGKKHGLWKWWRPDASLVCEANYDHGVLHGPLKRYHNDGKVSRAGEYAQGKAQGVHHFYRNKSYSQERFMNQVDQRVDRYEIHYKTNGQEDHREYFLADGTACSSKGFALLTVALDDLLTPGPNGFFPSRYQEMLGRIYPQLLAQDQSAALAKIKANFEQLWGMPLPEDLGQLYALWSAIGQRELFDSLLLALPKNQALLDQQAAGQNLFEAALLSMQQEYPYDHIIDWFTGGICLDQPQQQQNGRYRYGYYSYLYQLYGTEQEQGKIYCYEHNNNGLWGSQLSSAMAPNLSAWLFGLSAFSFYHEYELLSQEQFTNLYDGPLKQNFAPKYYFMNHVRMGNRYVNESDFKYRPKQNALVQQYNKSHWIIELFRAEGDPSSIAYNLYSNQPYKAPEQASDILSSVPEALYHLWSAFWLEGQAAKLPEYIALCKQSPALILQAAAELAEELNAGRKRLGFIIDLPKIKADFNRYAAQYV
ncbi:toxin-antitoxin system YwqK family antitoxin [Saprospira grandis]|uniref:Thioredoxin n=1 Tax=Saprospira grandis (strain Lewin) TaxID=984262 RepID=H6KZN3_SAPGL|nr:thioredoxin [Saprospira grandis]AFC25809.1 putative thioredoxin [Saprospira grandis str. Lewin]